MPCIITDFVPMRDGVKLFTKVFLPELGGKYNVLLLRNSYSSIMIPRLESLSNDNTLVVVEQDVRGSGSSEGEIDPWRQELEDGEDCLEWITRQPWFKERIVMTGVSYLGAVQWFAAASGNKALVAIEPGVAPCNYYDSPKYFGGQFVLQQNIQWGLERRKYNHPQDYAEVVLSDELSWHLPLNDIDREAGLGTVDYWQDWLNHPSYDDYWKTFDLSSYIARIKAPALIDSGWFDIYTQGSLDACSMLAERAGSDVARKFSRCVIGPWSHGENFGELPAEGDLRKASCLEPIKRKFRYGLLADPNKDPLPNMARFNYFMYGCNRWCQSDVWPPENTTETAFFLNSDGTANSLYGNGVLVRAKGSETEECDVFISNPYDPVPTGGGHFINVTGGSHDQTWIEKRSDVLVYTSGPLESNLEIAGRVKVILHAASTACDCDFTAKLVDVFPDGRAFNLADGIIRATHRESMTTWKLIEPGEIYEYEIDCWSIANCFLKGHRIRLEIAGSNFPQMARNNQTGHDPASDAELKIARQTVYHDAWRPSRLLLPVVNKGEKGKGAEG